MDVTLLTSPTGTLVRQVREDMSLDMIADESNPLQFTSAPYTPITYTTDGNNSFTRDKARIELVTDDTLKGATFKVFVTDRTGYFEYVFPTEDDWHSLGTLDTITCEEVKAAFTNEDCCTLTPAQFPQGCISANAFYDSNECTSATNPNPIC